MCRARKVGHLPAWTVFSSLALETSGSYHFARVDHETLREHCKPDKRPRRAYCLIKSGELGYQPVNKLVPGHSNIQQNPNKQPGPKPPVVVNISTDTDASLAEDSEPEIITGPTKKKPRRVTFAESLETSTDISSDSERPLVIDETPSTGSNGGSASPTEMDYNTIDATTNPIDPSGLEEDLTVPPSPQPLQSIRDQLQAEAEANNLPEAAPAATSESTDCPRRVATASAVLLTEVSRKLDDHEAILKHQRNNPRAPDLKPLAIRLKNCKTPQVSTPTLRVKSPERLMKQVPGPPTTKKRVRSPFTKDPKSPASRQEKIGLMLAETARLRGRQSPNNFDITAKVAGMIIDINRTETCTNPVYKRENLDAIQLYYSALLVQLEWYMEKRIAEKTTMPCPTLYDPRWVRHSWWWCTPSASLKNLIRARYHGLPTGPMRESWFNLDAIPEAENRARLDPFFAAW